jgi:hypothetical protein
MLGEGGTPMDPDRIELARVRLERVGYVDVAVPPETVGLDAAAVAAQPWADPPWAEEGQVRVGAAAWFAEARGERLVLDPVQATDGVLRADRATEAAQQDAIAAHFAAAGFDPASVDRVLMSHIEGVGMVARRDDAGAWHPFFPNARIALSAAQRDAFLEGLGSRTDAEDPERDAWVALLDAGLVDGFADGDELAPGVRAEVTDGHGPGHAVFHFVDADEVVEATFLGHLAISPLHLATGPCTALNEDPERAFERLQATAADGRRLLGPLWPAPGWGRWIGGEVRADGAPASD